MIALGRCPFHANLPFKDKICQSSYLQPFLDPFSKGNTVLASHLHKVQIGLLHFLVQKKLLLFVINCVDNFDCSHDLDLGDAFGVLQHGHKSSKGRSFIGVDVTSVVMDQSGIGVAGHGQ